MILQMLKMFWVECIINDKMFEKLNVTIKVNLKSIVFMERAFVFTAKNNLKLNFGNSGTLARL